MKQNGSLCAVIVGTLVVVSLATQTWFLAEDAERWRCDSVFSSLLCWPVGRCDHSNAGGFCSLLSFRSAIGCLFSKRNKSDSNQK